LRRGKPYLENSVMITEFSRCLIFGFFGSNDEDGETIGGQLGDEGMGGYGNKEIG
jgi:hypothetical protein